MTTVEELRAEIDSCDRILLEALAKRVTLVQAIAAQKQKETRALFDRDREREVLARALSEGAKVGLDDLHTSAFMRTLFEISHEVQAEARKAERLPSRTVLIVGGAGRMGQRFAAEFRARGHQVETLEKGQNFSTSRIAAADCIMLSVPMGEVADVARAVAPYVRPDAVLLDINSLKRSVCEVIATQCKGEAVGTHPMFGPTVRTFRRQKIVLCPIRPGPAVQWLVHEFGAMGLETVESNPETHDRMMARVQALTHFHKLALGEAWRREGTPLEETLKYVSPIYRLELAMVGRLFAQDPALYAEIEMENPWASEVRRYLLEAVEDLHEILEQGDRQGFTQLFARVREYQQGFSEEAMQLSDLIVDELVKKA